MGALKNTVSSIGKLMSTFDGEDVTYSPKNRHESFMKFVESGPYRDRKNLGNDMFNAIKSVSCQDNSK